MGKTTQIRIDSNLKNQIEALAGRKGVNIKDFIQIIFDSYLQQNKLDNLGQKQEEILNELNDINKQNRQIIYMINDLGGK